MNIVIHLDCAADILPAIVEDVRAVLSKHGLDSEYTCAGPINALNCFTPKAVDPEQVGCGTCGQSPCACNSVACASCGNEICQCLPGDQPVVAMVNVAPIGDGPVGAVDQIATDYSEPVQDLPPEPVPLVRDYGLARVLTLSTHLQIPTAVKPSPGQTSLCTTGRILSDGVVRFTYNGFEHALPVADAQDQSIINPTHSCGSSTVRLVIDIANKTYACLVDIEGGDSEVLLLGDDVIPAIEEPAANVPAQ